MERRADDLSPLETILKAGAVAGVLDISAAIGIYALLGVRPIRILQSVASGLLGRAAFAGGFRTAVLGLVLHLFIATVAAGVYYVASRKMRALAERPFVFGPLYGIAVFFFMHRIVLPLSAFPGRPIQWDMALIQIAVHIVCIGTPIAWIVRRGTVPAPAAAP